MVPSNFSKVAVVVLCLLSLATYVDTSSPVYGWGKNDQAQLGLGTLTSVFTPTAIPFYNNIQLINVLTATNYHIALAANGSAYASGLQFYGQFALGYTNTSSIKTPIFCPSLNTSLTISLPGTECNANYNTNLLGWANYAGYVQGKNTGSFPKVQSALSTYKFDGKVLAVNSVMEGTIVRLSNNTVWVVGNNGNGRLGNGNQTTIYNFVEATFWRNVSLNQIFNSQSAHTCALAANYSLFCWGQNTYGQLGVGDTNLHLTPTRVTFFDNGGFYPYKVSFGDAFTLVLTCGGRLFAFGQNNVGQLGQGLPDGTIHPTPVEVLVNNGNIGNATVVDIVTGLNQAMIRTDKNQWYIWGGGQYGTLGVGPNNDVYQPTLNATFTALGINHIASSSQSLNFFGWNDSSVINARLGCPALVNECLTNRGGCDINAYCTDMERLWNCTCIVGYIGDGNATGSGCINAQSCQAIGYQCSVNATCDDSSGVAQCICPDGFQGDGKTNGTGCQDINECLLGNPCAAYAFCTNLIPGYMCTCDLGFTGDPVVTGCTILCEPGTYATNQTNCGQCPPGTYTDVMGAQNCFPCPGGTYNDAWGSSSLSNCTQCPIGGYSEPKASYCSLCVHGYTNDPTVLHTDNTTCTACPVGYYGYYGQCYNCTFGGQYSLATTAKQCTKCEPGSINNSTQNGCTSCPAGTTSRGGSTACSTCPAGYYSSAGSTDCLKCPPGTSTNGLTGQSKCTNCTAGYYSARAAAPTCYACAAGTYSTGPGATICQRCSPGSFASLTGSTSCSKCTGNSYAGGSGNTQCVSCEINTVTTDGISCAPCTAGYYYNAGTQACVACAPGTFVAVTGSSACYACAQGSYASGSGSTYCKWCGINTYTNSTTGFTNCMACPKGKYSPGGAYTCS